MNYLELPIEKQQAIQTLASAVSEHENVLDVLVVGSLAMGDFEAPYSDLDILVLVKQMDTEFNVPKDIRLLIREAYFDVASVIRLDLDVFVRDVNGVIEKGEKNFGYSLMRSKFEKQVEVLPYYEEYFRKS